MGNKESNIAPVMAEGDGRIVLFKPYVPKNAITYIAQVLESRWIGQGPKVEEFERRFEMQFGHTATAVSCGSGTDALHLAYLLAGVRAGDEVICPIFTCTATNLPALYIGAKPVFVDIDRNTMNINIQDLKKKINDKTKAIVFVDYGGQPADLNELLKVSEEFGIPLIEDAAHALGARFNGMPIGSVSDYTIFSFQAIKHITTGDGGMLMVRDSKKVEEAKRLRWFGIDRNKKFNGIWENDISEIGFKYQMNDISAAMGLAALEEFSDQLDTRHALLFEYEKNLSKIKNLRIVGAPFNLDHAAWLLTIVVPDAIALRDYLLKRKIESGQVHFRNDRYTIFGSRRSDLTNMDRLESAYLVLPLHPHMSLEDVRKVCNAVRDFFENASE